MVNNNRKGPSEDRPLVRMNPLFAAVFRDETHIGVDEVTDIRCNGVRILLAPRKKAPELIYYIKLPIWLPVDFQVERNITRVVPLG